jgi:molybdopterin-guanine dinucleotide biosynthesis protein A
MRLVTMNHQADQFAGFILAGGRSSRMGRDKALLEIDGITMLDRAVELVVSAGISVAVLGAPAEFDRRRLRVPVIADEWPGLGPLGGIATALHQTQAAGNLIVACDMPYLTADWLRFLLQRAKASSADAVVPRSERGPEPLCAVYHRRAEGTIREALQQGKRKVTEVVTMLNPEYVEPGEWKAFDSGGLLFKNMNRPADYEKAQAISSRRAKT